VLIAAHLLVSPCGRVGYGADPAKPGTDLTRRLRVLQADYPRAYFFRAAEGHAANSRVDYATWERTFARLMGIEGKVLDEELPGRSRRNIDFFTRFKQTHPDQLVLLHYNGNSRDPRYETGKYFAGHWIYFNGAPIMSGLPAEEGETDVRVDDTRLFRMNIGRFKRDHDDIGLCLLGDDGKPDWSECEQVRLVSIDPGRKTIRVRRGCYGTRPRAFPAGRAYAAAHVTEGPWGRRSHLLWYYNYSTRCPKDDRGRACTDILVEELATRLGPAGALATFDGIEFDVLHYRTGGRRAGAVRGPDCDADGRADNGVFDKVNTYGIGVNEFCGRLQERLAGAKLILADGMSVRNQRAFGILNGIESEGWPHLSDWEIADWSGGLNRHWYWAKHARAPVFNYINHKFTMPGPTPGSRARPDVPFNVHRLVLAAAQFVDAAVCYSTAPPSEPDERFGIWDELHKGVEHEPGWLGKPVGPAVRLALTRPDLLVGQGRAMPAAFVERWTGKGVRFTAEGNRLCVSSTDSDSDSLQFRLRSVPCDGPDLFVSMTMRGEPLAGHSAGIARLTWVGVPEPESKLVSDDMPYAGMCVRGQREVTADATHGAVVRFFRGRSLGGEKRDCYLVHPPYKHGVGFTFWERDVHIPKDGQLVFFLGMGDKAPGRSDGVVFTVLAADVTRGQPGSYTQLFEATQVQSRWVRHVVSLAKWGGKRLRLRFVSDCGPADNSTTDHSHWGDVRVVDPAQPPETQTVPIRHMTWTGTTDFASGFYFPQMKSRTADLEFTVEGAAPIWISDLTVHAHPDAIYREFEYGAVLANPARHTYVFDLAELLPGRAYRRLRGSSRQDPETNDGRAAPATVTLGEREALFLVRVMGP